MTLPCRQPRSAPPRRPAGHDPAPARPTHGYYLLQRLGIDQTAMAEAIIQSGGRAAGNPLHPTVLNSMLLGHEERWPRTTPRREIERQAAAWLAGRGVGEADIRRFWQPAGGPPPPAPAAPRAAPSTSPILDDLPEAVMISETARRAFGLFGDPFTDDIQEPADVWLADEQHYVLEAMRQTIRNGGIVAVVGESGSGKTVLRELLFHRLLDDERMHVVKPETVDKSRLKASGMLDAILYDLAPGQPPRRTLEAKARQVRGLLARHAREGHRVGLFIEEAHDLSVETLKYLKRLMEMKEGLGAGLGIVLVGQPELSRLLDERIHFDAREVIARTHRTTLPALRSEEVRGYLETKFRRLGKRFGDLFGDDVPAAVERALTVRRGSGMGAHRESWCYPLRINNLIRLALNHAAEIGEPRVSAELIHNLGRGV
ncbi:ExeA family protein [Endothiovibrio diazotrophicus]